MQRPADFAQTLTYFVNWPKRNAWRGLGTSVGLRFHIFLVSIFTDFHEEEKKISYLCELCLILHPRIQL